MADLTRLGYHELAVRYDLGSVKDGGDIEILPDGNFVTTKDYDAKLGNDQHNALHRVLTRWRFNAPTIGALLRIVVDARERKAEVEAELENAMKAYASHEEVGEIFQRVQDENGIQEYGPPRARERQWSCLRTCFVANGTT